MVSIDFVQGTYKPAGLEYTKRDLATVSRSDLRWYYFLGHIAFVINDVDLSPPGEWVPVFDFISSMAGVIDHLRGDRSTNVGFTENAEKIVFRIERSDVEISATYSQNVATTSVPALSAGMEDFTDRICQSIFSEFPDLRLNPAVTALRERMRFRLESSDPDSL